MSKDNLVFALGGMVVGIVVGVLIATQGGMPRSQETPAESSQPFAAQQSGKAQSETQLPEGHPPIDEASMRKQIADQEEILKSDPENQEAVTALGNLNFDLKNYQEAAKWYQKAVEKDPNNVNLITDLGSSYLWLNDYQKAVDLYNRSLSIDPKHFQTLMNVGIALMSMGDKTGAAEAWEKVIQYHPTHPEVSMLKDAVKKLREKPEGS